MSSDIMGQIRDCVCMNFEPGLCVWSVDGKNNKLVRPMHVRKDKNSLISDRVNDSLPVEVCATENFGVLVSPFDNSGIEEVDSPPRNRLGS